jgi:hypothetical protein
MINHLYTHARGLLLVMCYTLSIAACALVRPTPEIPLPPGAAELPTLLQQRTAYWQAYQAQLAIRLQGPKGKFHAQATLLAMPPDSLRLEASSLAGQTIWLLICNPQEAILWLPAEKVLYKAKRSETILNHLMGAPIPTQVFIYSFVGCIPPDQLTSQKFRISQEGSKLLGRFKDRHFKWLFDWELAASPPALRALNAVEAQTDQHYSIRFDPAVHLDPVSKPDRVFISSRDWQLETAIKQMERTDALSAFVFSLPAISGVRVVDL